jgi:glycine cleavage system transcriptional repressor
MDHAIITAIGEDRPGLVDEVSQFIFERGGNIADSRMVNLRGQFAVMVLVMGDAPTLQRIAGDLEILSAQSKLHAELRPAATIAAPVRAQARPYRLRASAMDQAGLVHRLAHLLRQHNVNIENLQTQLSAAPITGAPVFAMDMVVSVPEQTPLHALRQALGRLCDDLNIDWDLSGV